MENKIYCMFCICVLKVTAMKHQERHEVCILKVCQFYFLFFREDISVTDKVDGEQRWWPRFGAAPGFCR